MTLVPVFKFMKVEHSKKLLEQGNVHIPTIKEFRNSTIYSGTIYDRNEGKFCIINQYLAYDTRNGIFGLLRFSEKELNGSKISFKVMTKDIDLPQSNIYCVTNSFFSGTLNFAIEEDKDSCVLISDINAFNDVLNKNLFNTEFIGIRDCYYNSRVLMDTNPNDISETEILINEDYKHIYWVKPKKFSPQCEVRSVWRKKNEDNKPINKDIPELKQYCIELKFPTIYKYIKDGNGTLENLRVRATVHDKDGRVGEYIIKSKDSIFSPEVFTIESKLHLGFKSNSKNLQGLTVQQGKYGIYFGDYGLYILTVELENLDYIEYSVA